ncbi:MAG: HAMP domain-containing histidine kinase [Hydrogenobacter thermophilus]|uniref:sensor histidine kinase n=1 Tax=Hydrogenobacter thermophilus TaxID=940 RepID=UPI001C77C918|nr:HAMP domain-containing sensor histidine kinase [Hydrogenobacter thermophilus]QWK19335.1 MAG: HAMP domain-containing histidine kinase [Hydrogenobacter thermophilus]
MIGVGITIFTLIVFPFINYIFWIDLITNSIISFFCGIVALAVSFLFVFEFLKAQTFFSFFLFLSFYSSGISDIYASFITDIKAFIWIRVINTLTSSAFLYLGCLAAETRYSRINSNLLVKILIFLAVISSIIFGFLFRTFSPSLPEPLIFKNLDRITYEGLNKITVLISVLSIILFIMSAYLLYRMYLKYREELLLYMSFYSIMMANISFLFTLSTLWNIIWWIWHILRLLVYIFLFGLFLFGFIYLFNNLNRKTKELTTAYNQLKATQEKLVASERIATAGMMAATIMHEIRTPIATINNLIQLLSSLDIKNNYETFVELKELLKEEIYRIKRITEIFNLSYNQYIPKRHKVKLSEVMKSWIESFKQLYANLIVEKNVDIESYIEEDIYANIDIDGFRVCLYNLLQNAIESTHNGRIFVNLRRVDDKIEVSVEDTGVGIPEENISKVFDPFYTSKTKGLGLGLFIVKKIVDAHEGEIKVVSSLGRGSKFSIFIPTF